MINRIKASLSFLLSLKINGYGIKAVPAILSLIDVESQPVVLPAGTKMGTLVPVGSEDVCSEHNPPRIGRTGTHLVKFANQSRVECIGLA